MKESKISRRTAIGSSLLASMAAISGLAFKSAPQHGPPDPIPPSKKKLPVRISLNTSTISAYELPVDKQIDRVAGAGFDGIELWMRDITSYLDSGGKIEALREKLQSGSLVLENIIGFAAWCSDDAEERMKAIGQLRKEMVITAGLGGKYIAAPVLGIDALDPTKFDDYAERYNAILELEGETGVTPILEIWGAGALNNLADCAHIVIGTGHPKATMLLDFYHLYRGGSDWDTLDCLNGKRLPVIHMNDYPAEPARSELTDAHRVLPGEGICPYRDILPKLYKSGFRGGLSVELFNREYWASMDAETMLKNSYEKTVAVVEEALAPMQ
jgi:2-keto-myo-inositol isomerase